ncbi:hypothetical protein L207DRAFT_413826 [Hyaloscypha variabilis F]|uniref:Uncharacterized protein n=1 Tax=Hyaloscypha variabilis (strain UAMH 11265 / GT02V1 / F) TaxID=1149755 RepID=A0A2J6SCI6_HYAVF|nr:hypothetical protein L207DRAFT_413826 [Hyaloscypha variabilis F]
MNRFRTKKKAKEAEGLVRVSTDSDGPPLAPVKSSKTFRRGKKIPEPEPKLEIDLATALPSSDDFRTSLLMSGLSARFSMLREQDDPKSKIGKASDDSVLFPKRQSRLNDFGFQSHGLSDIAEVASINGSIRPPFAFGRADSFHTTDGYGTDDDSTHTGSIMNRSKPGEGNNLFGGRQKIYKIAVNASGSSKSPTDSTTGGMGGRALYENDVSQSAFQRLREREREQERRERAERQEREEMEAHSSRPSSPPLSGYNRNRETSSTTSSAGPSNTRTSTAATSFTSQRTPSLSGAHTPVTPNLPNSGTPVLERSTTKARRLYETGFDQHLHDQQFSAMNRIDTLNRQRTLGAQTPPLGLSPTAAPNVSERWDRHQLAGKASMPNLRAASPPPTNPAIGAFDFAVRPNNAAESKPFGMTSPPLSPPMSEHDDPISLALQPNDRIKATALGAFSKPNQPYDENKYSQRQLQMQQGRETPPPRKNSPPRAFVPRQQQQQMNRTRADSNATFASDSSRSNSSAQRHFLPQDRIPETSRSDASVPENKSTGAGTFLNSPDGSSQGSLNDVMQEPTKPKVILRPLDLYAKYRQEQPITLERPPESEHPANRQTVTTETSNEPTAPSLELTATNLQPNSAPHPPADSPTLGPTVGLIDIRQHLRSDSNSSSIYGGVPSAGITSRFPLEHTEPLPQNDYTAKNNPWDQDEWDHDYYRDANFGQDASSEVSRPEEILPAPHSARATNFEATGQDLHKPSWEKEMENHHTRNGSSETQKERQDFKNELATRRRQVKEHLKSFVETEGRAESPMLGSEVPKEALPIRNNPLGLLKPKSSRGSLMSKAKEPGQTKAMKMLGIGNATMTSSTSPGKQSFEDNPWQQEEEEMVRGVQKQPTSPPQTRAFRQARRDAQRDREKQVAMRHQQNQQRMAAEASESEWSNSRMDQNPRQRAPSGDRVPPNIRTGPRTQSNERRQHPPPVTHSFNTARGRDSKDSAATSRSGSRPPSLASRDRSGSDTSGGRSKSRNGRYRDDLAKAMAEGTSSSGQAYYEELEVPSARFAPRSPGTPGMGFSQSPIPSPMLGSNSRSRSNSNLAAPGYFEGQKSPMMLASGRATPEIGLAPRPSPTAPFVVNATPALVQPSPAGSGANTPTAQGFQNPGGIPTHRKRSINKSDISEPRFISSTSRVTTVNLPPGSSLQNGAEVYAPPIPPVNPRRRQTRAIFGTLIGKKDEYEEIHSMPSATQSTEEMSTFSADEGDYKIKNRQKLRKSSSEGGNLNARARQAAQAVPSPAVPAFPPGSGSPPRLAEGGMF